MSLANLVRGFRSRGLCKRDIDKLLDISQRRTITNEFDFSSLKVESSYEEMDTSFFNIDTNPVKQKYIIKNTRSSSGPQQLGRFDRLTIFENQRWAINYVNAGESFTNINNISSTFLVLEMQDLFASDIIARVQAFINGTKN